MTRTDNEPLTLRLAAPQDAAALHRLAELDSSTAPQLPVLLAEAGGEVRAALSLVDHHVVADPFHRTSDLVALLRERAYATRRGVAPRRTRPRGRTRLAIAR
jgi:hypothetical protein